MSFLESVSATFLFFSFYVSEISSKLGDVVQVSDLASCIFVKAVVHGRCQWFVVGKDCDVPTFQQLLEVLDGQVNR